MKPNNSQRHDAGRRGFLGMLLTLGAGAVAAGCTPARAVLGMYDRRYERDRELADSTLRAFAATIIPDAPIDDPNLVQGFRDRRLPFHEHVGLFAADLARRSRLLFGVDRFDALDHDRRARVVRYALASDKATVELYNAAILVVQATFYGSMYTDDGSCPTIEFPGANAGYSPEEMCYADAAGYLPSAMTDDGNCV